MSEGEMTVDGFALKSCVAAGNYSQVWEVAEGTGGASFAMKLLLPDALKSSEQKNALKHEGKVGQSLEHPNIIRVHRTVLTRDHGYILMEFFRAPNLKSQIRSDIVVLHARMRKLLESICVGLGYMHDKGWLHRDIKPDNILFSKGSELKLIDFSLSSRTVTGLAKMFGGKVKTIQGTRTYIAPETILKKPPTIQTDIYSLGITLFEILTGHTPFKGSSPNDLLKKHISTAPPPPSSLNSNITPEMDKLILRLLSKKPADRPRHMNEIFADLRGIKIFKEDVVELAQRKGEEAKQKQLESLDEAQRLDSRADALRKELGLESTRKKVGRAAVQKVEPVQPKPAAPPPQQQMPSYPQQAPPGYPQPFYPGPPGYPQQPGGFPPQFAPPQGAAPYYAQPGQGGAPGYPPGYPPQQTSYPQMPGGPPPQQMPQPPLPPQQQRPQQGAMPAGAQQPAPAQQRPPVPQQGAAPQGAPQPARQPTPQQAAPVPQRPASRPPAPPKSAPPAETDADLPLMDELPEVR